MNESTAYETAYEMAKNLRDDLKAMGVNNVHSHQLEAYKALLKTCKELCKGNAVVQAIPEPDPRIYPHQLAALAGQLEAALRQYVPVVQRR